MHEERTVPASGDESLAALSLPIVWEPWFDLSDAAARRTVKSVPGLYRVRRRDDGELVYVGQTSILGTRLRQLAVLYQAAIPYNDPHTATPCLWVLRTQHGVQFEVSVAHHEADVAARKAAECVVISQYRRDSGRSPFANFGRMPEGWIKSSQNNLRLAGLGRVRRGYADPAAHRAPDHPSVLDPLHSPQSPMWSAQQWSEWTTPITAAPDLRGVYRVRSMVGEELVYLGQGNIRDRLRAHAAKSRQDGHRQQTAFTGDLEASWVELPQASSQQLLEIECDLIAGHVLRLGEPPVAEFWG